MILNSLFFNYDLKRSVQEPRVHNQLNPNYNEVEQDFQKVRLEHKHQNTCLNESHWAQYTWQKGESFISSTRTWFILDSIITHDSFLLSCANNNANNLWLYLFFTECDRKTSTEESCDEVAEFHRGGPGCNEAWRSDLCWIGPQKRRTSCGLLTQTLYLLWSVELL